MGGGSLPNYFSCLNNIANSVFDPWICQSVSLAVKAVKVFLDLLLLHLRVTHFFWFAQKWYITVQIDLKYPLTVII